MIKDESEQHKPNSEHAPFHKDEGTAKPQRRRLRTFQEWYGFVEFVAIACVSWARPLPRPESPSSTVDPKQFEPSRTRPWSHRCGGGGERSHLIGRCGRHVRKRSDVFGCVRIRFK